VGFCVLSVLSVGFLGLVLGTLLLNYMNFYVAELVRMSVEPGWALAFGWPVWAVLRVLGFVASGTALAALGLAGWRRLRGGLEGPRFPARVMLVGFALVVADAILKALLAPGWRSILIRSLEP
jgi:hypothetical protein